MRKRFDFANLATVHDPRVQDARRRIAASHGGSDFRCAGAARSELVRARHRRARPPDRSRPAVKSRGMARWTRNSCMTPKGSKRAPARQLACGPCAADRCRPGGAWSIFCAPSCSMPSSRQDATMSEVKADDVRTVVREYHGSIARGASTGCAPGPEQGYPLRVLRPGGTMRRCMQPAPADPVPRSPAAVARSSTARRPPPPSRSCAPGTPRTSAARSTI